MVNIDALGWYSLVDMLAWLRTLIDPVDRIKNYIIKMDKIHYDFSTDY